MKAIKSVEFAAARFANYRDFLMPELRAFADESGKANDPRCKSIAMASVIGEPDSWEVFYEKWHAMCVKHDIPYLHMKEITGARHTKKGPFARFFDPGLLNNLLSNAVECLIDANLFSCALAIWTDDLKQALKRYGLTSDPLAFCLYQIVVQTGTWALNAHPTHPCFFMLVDRVEQGSVKLSQAEKLYKSDRFASWRGWPDVKIVGRKDKEGSRQIIGLQAADLVAWSMRYHLNDIREWMKETKPTLKRNDFDTWNSSLQSWMFAKLDRKATEYPVAIAFYRVWETLKIANCLKFYPYDLERLETHILSNGNSEVDSGLKARTILDAGRFPLTPNSNA